MIIGRTEGDAEVSARGSQKEKSIEIRATIFIEEGSWDELRAAKIHVIWARKAQRSNSRCYQIWKYYKDSKEAWTPEIKDARL